jgi:hypothetical protein
VWYDNGASLLLLRFKYEYVVTPVSVNTPSTQALYKPAYYSKF